MRRLACVVGAFVATLGLNAYADDEPKPAADAPKADAPGGAPKSEAERLQDLEKKLDEQQKKIDELRKEEAERAARAEARSGEKSDDSLSIGFKDGFFLKGRLLGSPYEIRPVARIQLDYRAFPHSSVNDAFPHSVPQDEFLVRRAAVGFMGNLNDFAYQLEVDPVRIASNFIPLVNFWFEWRTYKEFRIRLGHFKTPWDLEDSMQSDNYLDMIERPMVAGSGNTVAPDFRPGAEILGKIGGDIFQYWLSVMNQTDTNSPTVGDPLTSARLESDVAGFGLGVGGIWANLSGVQTSFQGLTPGFYQFFTPVSVRGWSQRYCIDVCYYNGPFFGRGEFVYASQERWRVLADHSNGTGLVTQGAVLTTGFMFAGPPRDAKHPISDPFKGWDFFSMDIERKKSDRNVGAEIVVRLEWMGIDDTHGGRRGQGAVPAIPSTAANADIVKGNDCKAVELGFNLDVIENVRFQANWIHLRVGDETRSERAHSRIADEFLFRAQLEF